jgi:hypothetical protein
VTQATTARLWNAAFALAVLSLIAALYIGFRYANLVECMAARSLADQERTAAIAPATDRERAADLKLLESPSSAAREEALAARRATDKVRAEHPVPAVKPCR